MCVYVCVYTHNLFALLRLSFMKIRIIYRCQTHALFFELYSIYYIICYCELH